MTPVLTKPEPMTRRLTAEFTSVPSEDVDRCVCEVRACASHLGIELTPAMVERIAREHLTGRVKSEPPSGRGR